MLTTDKSRGLDVHEKQCVALVERNELKRAESNCRLCLEFEERHANCLNAYGVIHLANGDDDAARKLFTRAIRENNDHGQARSNMGNLEFKSENYESAIELYASAIEIDPHFRAARLMLARSHLRLALRALGKHDEAAAATRLQHAEDQYRMLIEIDAARATPDAAPFGELGVIEMQRGNVALAEQWLKQCIQLAPESVECNGNLGHLFVGVGRYVEAMPLLERCIASASGASATTSADAAPGAGAGQSSAAGDAEVCRDDLNAARKGL